MVRNKILILLCYFERPNLVKGFLRSLVAADRHYDNWELCFIDDGSVKRGKPVADKILRGHLHKVRYVNSGMTPDMKRICGGTFIGKYMNEAVRSSDAAVAIMAGDDDELHPEYLLKLNDYFNAHPEVLSCYSMVHTFDPLKEKTCDVDRLSNADPDWKGHSWFGKPIDCAYKVDGVQVAWRTKCNRVLGAWFQFPTMINHDALFFKELNARCRKSAFTGFVSMYKGVHDGQLVKSIQGGRGAFGEGGVIDRPDETVLF